MKERNVFYFKSCPKCGGDMYQEQDVYGAFRKCLQCGRIFELEMPQPGSDKAKSDRMAA
jgi:DNA-directed RNA polymerase subunit M/transcription elongation factor TFIIS